MRTFMVSQNELKKISHLVLMALVASTWVLPTASFADADLDREIRSARVNCDEAKRQLDQKMGEPQAALDEVDRYACMSCDPDHATDAGKKDDLGRMINPCCY